MKFEIANVGESKNEEKIVRLGLEKYYDDTVNLVVLDENGESFAGGFLLEISPNGVFCRMGGVNPDLGFPLNGDNEIIIE